MLRHKGAGGARLARLSLACAVMALACGTNSSPTMPSPTPAPAPAPSASPQPTPVVTFGPGQHRVGTDVQPGRYYADPASGCYWERQSGSGGTSADTIAFVLIDFDAAQWIVEILPSDRGFETRPSCGAWFSTPRHGAQTSIPPGVWVVGAQVTPGLYRASAGAGCYWQRVRHFNGEPDGIIASDLVASASVQFVTISATDAGFRSDAPCGTWTPADTTVSR